MEFNRTSMGVSASVVALMNRDTFRMTMYSVWSEARLAIRRNQYYKKMIYSLVYKDANQAVVRKIFIKVPQIYDLIKYINPFIS